MSVSGPPIEEMTVGWRLPRRSPSLPEAFRTVSIPRGASWWRKMLAFAGPGYLVAVGLHGPGQLGHRPRRRRRASATPCSASS